MAEWRWPNFSPEEIASNKIINAATGERMKAELMIDPRSMDMLQKLRPRLDKPLVINSAYRSDTYNAQIGSAPNGFHPKAMAFDVSMAKHDPTEFEAAATAVGFRGIPHLLMSVLEFLHGRSIGASHKWRELSGRVTARCDWQLCRKKCRDQLNLERIDKPKCTPAERSTSCHRKPPSTSTTKPERGTAESIANQPAVQGACIEQEGNNCRGENKFGTDR